MPWHPVASGMCDRNVNAADGVGSWKHEPRTHPAHADGRLVYNGADRDAKMEIPANRRPITPHGAMAARTSRTRPSLT